MQQHRHAPAATPVPTAPRHPETTATGRVTAGMRAARLHRPGQPLQLDVVPRPEPHGTEVLVRVAAAGLSACDLDVLDGVEEVPLPQTPGHEVAGHVAALGPRARGVALGEAVLVHGWWGCGTCPECRAGEEHLCAEARRPGAAAPGGFADFLLVPHPRSLVPLGALDPAAAAPLADAGLVTYRAVHTAASVLAPGSAAVVIGCGGLGQLAVQMLRLLTPARVLVVDSDHRKEAPAREAGADRFIDLQDWHAVRGALGDLPAMAVLDFSGSDATVELGARVLAPGGLLVVCGRGPGKLRLALLPLPPGAAAVTERGGSRADLEAVVELARSGRLRLRVQRYQLDRVNDAVTALRAGWVRSRAVIVPRMA
ncbi:MAG TPA: alcohol dehydrogenase catalytic domain-containing protein [Candidatus Dormibacteraeota bacterium]|nr:alcohol dehydrogenase catalytic domain-containing protein [Candidatus Dormibacteraeota bacterium]